MCEWHEPEGGGWWWGGELFYTSIRLCSTRMLNLINRGRDTCRIYCASQSNQSLTMPLCRVDPLRALGIFRLAAPPHLSRLDISVSTPSGLSGTRAHVRSTSRSVAPEDCAGPEGRGESGGRRGATLWRGCRLGRLGSSRPNGLALYDRNDILSPVCDA